MQQQRPGVSRSKFLLPPGANILSEKVVEHEVKMPKKIVREEVIQRMVVVPEKVISEEVVEETRMVREKVVEIAKPIVQERLLEVPEIHYVDKIVEVPEKIIQEKIRQVPRIEVQERIHEVVKLVQQEKIVEVPEIEYREFPVERIVEVPQIMEKTVVREVTIPQYVDMPVAEVHNIDVPVDVPRQIPVPVEIITTQEFQVPSIRPRVHKVPLTLYIPRFIEVPIDENAFTPEMRQNAINLQQQLTLVGQQAAPSLCEVEDLAASIKKTDFASYFQTTDVTMSMRSAWDRGSLFDKIVHLQQYEAELVRLQQHIETQRQLVNHQHQQLLQERGMQARGQAPSTLLSRSRAPSMPSRSRAPSVSSVPIPQLNYQGRAPSEPRSRMRSGSARSVRMRPPLTPRASYHSRANSARIPPPAAPLTERATERSRRRRR